MKKSILFAAALLTSVYSTADMFCSSASKSAAARADSDGADKNTKNIVYQDWQDSKRGRSLPIKIYLPESGKAPYPVMIFSHGLGGSREAAIYLGDYWSQHGYLCVFVQHPGSDTEVWKGSVASGREGIMAKLKSAANARNLIDRAGDIKFVLNELELRNQNDALLKNQLDLNKIGLAGHSFGAGTTLAIAGQSYSDSVTAKDERIKVAIYLCPPVIGAGNRNFDPNFDPNFDSSARYRNIKIPGLLLTGTEDNSPIGNTKAADRRIPFDGIKSPHQYLVNFDGADHSVFGGRSFRAAKDTDEKFHQMIEVVTTKFLDANLKDDSSAESWLDSSAATSFFGKSAVYEHK